MNNPVVVKLPPAQYTVLTVFFYKNNRRIISNNLNIRRKLKSRNIMDSLLSKLKITAKNGLESQKILSIIMAVIDLKRIGWKYQPKGTFSN